MLTCFLEVAGVDPPTSFGGLDDFDMYLIIPTGPLPFLTAECNPLEVSKIIRKVWLVKFVPTLARCQWGNLATNERRLGNSPKSGADSKGIIPKNPQIAGLGMIMTP